MENELEQKLRELIPYAYAHAPAVKAIFDQAGISPLDIQTLSDLEKVPITSKDRLAELQQAHPPFGGFLAVPPSELKHIFLSPGPLYEPDAGESAVMDSVRAMLHIAGFQAGEVALNAFGYHLIPTGLALDAALQEMGLTVVPAGVGNAELQVQLLHKLKISAYLGTPSWLMALLKKAEELGMQPQRDFSLNKALVSAEPLPPSLRQSLVQGYGLRVTNAYGTAELGFLAYDQEGALAMHLLETSIVQIAHPESGKSVAPGEVGEVVVTSFNRAYPLIRLGTGDLAMNIDPKPGVSRQSERAIILVGRVGDAVKVRGMFVHPNQLRFAVGQVPGVAHFQAQVTRRENRDFLTLRVVTKQAEADRAALTQALLQAVQGACRVKADEVEFVDSLEEGAALIEDKRVWE